MTAYDEELKEIFTNFTNEMLHTVAVRCGGRGAPQELSNRALAGDEDARHWYNEYIRKPRPWATFSPAQPKKIIFSNIS